MPKYDVSESILIDADLASVRSIVRDFHTWESWSPWLSSEPDCPLTYADDGKSYSWDGDVIGSGKIALVKEDDDALWMHISFYKPWKSESDVDYQFKSEGSGTKVTWQMHGSLPFFMFWMKKMMCAWLSADFRRGLAKLKDYAETGAVPSRNEIAGLGDGQISRFVGLRKKCNLDDISKAMPEQYKKLQALIEEGTIKPSGAPIAVYHKMDIVKSVADYTAAIPVETLPEKLPTGFISGELNAPRTFKVKHTGAYRHLGSAWSAAMMHKQNKVFKASKSCDPFEIYANDPASTDEGSLLTEIHYPAR